MGVRSRDIPCEWCTGYYHQSEPHNAGISGRAAGLLAGCLPAVWRNPQGRGLVQDCSSHWPSWGTLSKVVKSALQRRTGFVHDRREQASPLLVILYLGTQKSCTEAEDLPVPLPVWTAGPVGCSEHWKLCSHRSWKNSRTGSSGGCEPFQAVHSGNLSLAAPRWQADDGLSPARRSSFAWSSTFSWWRKESGQSWKAGPCGAAGGGATGCCGRCSEMHTGRTCMAFLRCVNACGLQGGARRLRQTGTAGSGEASLLGEKGFNKQIHKSTMWMFFSLFEKKYKFTKKITIFIPGYSWNQITSDVSDDLLFQVDTISCFSGPIMKLIKTFLCCRIDTFYL